MPTSPLIIGHRGACGYLPEHTLESYRCAFELGADVVETDVVMTRDRQLICRHDCELSVTTNVADRPEFASRRTTRVIEGVEVQGWFVHDFTLDEIRLLRARERFPFRDHSYDNQFGVLSLADLLDFALRQRTRSGRPPGVIIEIKHANYFDSIGLPMDEAIVRTLSDSGMGGPPMSFESQNTGEPPVPQAWVESFEIDVLRRLRGKIQTPIIQLLDGPNMRPADVLAAGRSLTYGDMATPAGLAEITTYATGVGAWKRLILPALLDGGPSAEGLRLGPPTSMIADAHAKGLAVHAWTFRGEPQFLVTDYGNDPAKEYQQFAALGLDGFITDFPDVARAALTTTIGAH